MYCKNCGNIIENGDECIICNKKEPKINSILSLVFSFLIFPLGFIMSIIGIIRCIKYKKITKKTSTYLPLNIVALILSMIEGLVIMIVVLFATGMIYLFSSIDSTLEGTWKCNNYYLNGDYDFRFENKKITIQNNSTNEIINGKYNINSRNSTNGTNTYKMLVTYDNNKSENLSITFNKDSASIYMSYHPNVFICSKENN